jgi:short-subunit dehydrogenase
MQQMKTNVNVTTVTPYYINTGMFDGVRSSFIPILKPGTVARKIIRGIECNRLFISMPWSVHFVRLSQGLLPFRAYDWLVGKVMGIYKTMDHFKGRQN